MISKVLKKDIKKVVLEMNKFFINSKKNKKFILWQYFNDLKNSRLYKIKKKNLFGGIAGYEEKILLNKKAIRIIGVYIIKKFHGTDLIYKLLTFLETKIFLKKPFYAIPNKDFAYVIKNIFTNLNEIIIKSYKLKKKNFSLVKIKNKKSDFTIYPNQNLFKKNKKYYQWRYYDHPINDYIILEDKNLKCFFKIYNFKNYKYLDLSDCIIKKKISLHFFINFVIDKCMFLDFDELNIWTLEGSKQEMYLKKIGFSENSKLNKFFIFQNIFKKKNLKDKFIYFGDSDY